MFNGVYLAREHPARVSGGLQPALTAVELSYTCKVISAIVTGDLLLYKNKNFEFRNAVSMLTYLVALSPERRNAIKSIRLMRNFNNCAPTMKILSTCLGLKRLEIDITTMGEHFQHLNLQVPQFETTEGYAAVIKLRGVEVKLVYDDTSSRRNFMITVLVQYRPFLRPLRPEHVESLRNEVVALQDAINAHTRLPRPPVPTYTAEQLQEAADQANLHPQTFTCSSE